MKREHVSVLFKMNDLACIEIFRIPEVLVFPVIACVAL